MDQSKYVQIRKATLYTTVGPNDVVIKLLDFFTLDGAQLTMTDFGGVFGSGTLEPGTLKEEIISFTGISYDVTGTVASLTGVTRRLRGIDPYTTGADPQGHNAGRIFIITNNPQFYARFANKYNNEDILQAWTFFADGNAANPLIDVAAYDQTDDREYIHKGFADRTYVSYLNPLPMQGDLDMGGFNIINMADGVNPQDAVTINQLQSAIISGAMPASTTVAGIALIATLADWQNIADTQVIGLNTYYNLPPISYIRQPADETEQGMVSIATQAEFDANTDTRVIDGQTYYLVPKISQIVNGIAQYINTSTTVYKFDDFLGGRTDSFRDFVVGSYPYGMAGIGELNWTGFFSLGSNDATEIHGVPGETGRPGILRIESTSSSGGGGIALGYSQSNFITDTQGADDVYFEAATDVTGMGPMNQGNWSMTWSLRPSVTNLTLLEFGAQNSPNSNNDGIYFQLTGGNWRGVCSNGGTDSFTASTVAATTSFKKFEIIMNAAGTSVEFKVDGVSLGSVTTNIPPDQGRPNLYFLPVAVSGDYVDIDYFAMTMETAAR